MTAIRFALPLFALAATAACTLASNRDRSSETRSETHVSPRAQSLAEPSLLAEFGPQNEFFFGNATAPAHVEDQLDDGWLRFAREGRIRAFDNQVAPEERLRFWTQPEPELDLAAETGARVLRMGVDWGRLAPNEPGTNACNGICPEGIQDRQALAHYKEIVKKARSRGLSIMMTLFHHSAPQWALRNGGWVTPSLVDHFLAFTQEVVQEFASDVDLWIPINEPGPYLLFSYVEGMWPPGEPRNPMALLGIGPFQREFGQAVLNITRAHNEAYKIIHATDGVMADPWLPDAAPARVGIAQLAMFSRPSRGLIDTPFTWAFDSLTKFKFTDRIAPYLDFLGINYYGEETVRGLSVEISNRHEYSDSGRAINPYGLYSLLRSYHWRYNVQHFNRPRGADGRYKTLPIIITENGVSDGSDLLRRSYVTEHLLAVAAARKEGIPVQGYIHWTLSDNWEWLDGYCPKFGLAEVDRANGMARHKRGSFEFFRSIVETGSITQAQRDEAWNLVRGNVGKARPFCRSLDGKTGLDAPVDRPIADVDWRFSLAPE